MKMLRISVEKCHVKLIVIEKVFQVIPVTETLCTWISASIRFFGELLFKMNVIYSNF